MKFHKLLFLFPVLILFSTQAFSSDNELSKAIAKQVESASDCQIFAYDLTFKNIDSDKSFKDCVARRAILIAMQKKYGPGQYGQVDIIDKIEAYSYLADSSNEMVKKEASTYFTAAGAPN